MSCSQTWGCKHKTETHAVKANKGVDLTTAAGGQHRVLLRQGADGQICRCHRGLQGQARDGLDDHTSWDSTLWGLERAALRGQARLPCQLLGKHITLLQSLLQKTRVDLQSRMEVHSETSSLSVM